MSKLLFWRIVLAIAAILLILWCLYLNQKAIEEEQQKKTLAASVAARV